MSTTPESLQPGLLLTLTIIAVFLTLTSLLACRPQQTARLTITPTSPPTLEPTDTPTAPPTVSNNPTPEPTPTPPFALYEGGSKEYFHTKSFELLTQGDRLARQGDYQRALLAYKEAEKHRPKPSRVIHNRLGTAYQALGDYQTAIEHYTTALAVKETGPGYLSRAKVFFEEGNCNAAAKDAQSTLSYQSTPFLNRNTHFDAHAILAMCEAYDGYTETARSHAREALDIAQTSDLSSDIIDEVKSQIDLIGVVDPLLPPAQQLAAEAVNLFGSGLYDQALQKLKEAQKAHAKPSSDIQHLISSVYYDKGNFVKAIEHSSIAIAIKPHPVTHLIRADAYYAQNQCTLATSDADRSLDLITASTDPAYIQAGANFIKALCTSYSGDLQGALQHLEQAISHAKQAQYTPEAFQELTDHKREWQSSVSGLDKEYFHPATHSYFQQGENHLAQGNFEEALQAFQQAINNHPYPSRILQSRIAIAYQGLGQHNTAIEHFSNALQVRETPLGLSNRASVYAETSQCTLAVSDAEGALKSKDKTSDRDKMVAQSHATIANCVAQNSDLSKALHHIDIAIASAISAHMDSTYIQLLKNLRAEWSAENRP